MNRDGIQSLANAGRFGDTELIHATKGEVVIPPNILNKNPSLVQAIRAELAKENTSLDEVTVGSQLASVNPQTGLQEFFIKPLFKKLKKGASSLFGGLKRVLGKVAPLGLGLLIPGIGGPLSSFLSGAGTALGSGITSLIPGSSGIVSALGNIGSGILGGAKGIRQGIGSLFGLTQPTSGPMGPGPGSSSSGGFGNFLSNLGSGIGSFRKGFEDAFGFDPGLLALATTFGKATERALEKEAGGMKEIRDTIRPDLAQQTYGGAPTFDVGFAEGGVVKMQEGGDPAKKSFTEYQPEGLLSGTFFDYIPDVQQRTAFILDKFFGTTQPNTIIPGIPKGVTKEENFDAAFKKARKALGPGKTFKYKMEGDTEFKTYTTDFKEEVSRNKIGMAGGGSIFPNEKVSDMRAGGESIGPGTGTSDDIPAMLSDGEFVMTAKANRGAGAINMKKGKDGIMQLIPQGKADREKGADNMMSLMRYFENLA